jgi:Dullard-like phosphatase family protein
LLRRRPMGLSRGTRRALSTLLPPSADTSRLTLCLDLDECLVHCTVEESSREALSFMEPSGAEAVRAAASHAQLMNRPNGVRSMLPPDAEIELPYLDTPLQLRKRPLLNDFLAEACKLAELVLFTAAADGYAKRVTEQIDPNGDIFGSRLLTRAQCTKADGAFVKDLSQLGRPLERLVLVDDHLASSMLQPDNLAPIRPYLGDPDDRELGALLPLLRTLHGEADVRGRLRDEFKLQEKLLDGVRAVRAQWQAR